MKKKYRNIVVNDQAYTWRACRYNCDGDGGLVIRIFRNKIKIIDEFLTAKNSRNITPKTVSDIIKTNTNSWGHGVR